MVRSMEINIILFDSSYRKIEKILSLHHAMQELCDESEDLALNENFCPEKFDQIRNKFKQVRNP